MARRILIAVFLLAAVILALRLAMVAREFDTIVTSARFDTARANHTDLRAFLRRMPKGGDLHTHLSGAVYAERFIAWAAQQHLCANTANVLLSKPQCEPGDVSAADAMHDQKPLVFEEGHDLFPSDGLITQLRLLRGLLRA